MNDVKSNVYAQKVELLLRLIPIVMEEEVFAIHGGTAINLKVLLPTPNSFAASVGDRKFFLLTIGM